MPTIKKIFGLFILGVFLTCSPNLSFAADDTIIAIVNNELITLKDLHEYLTSLYMQFDTAGKSEAEIKEQIKLYEDNSLERLIDDKLLVDEANRKELIIRDKLIEDKLEEIKSHYSSDREFEDSLASDGLTITDLRKKILDQLKIKYIIELEIKQKIFVNPQEVTDYYAKNKSQMKTPERLDLQSIFIPYQEGGQTRAKQRIQEALNRLKKGENFDAVQKEYSQMPSIGLISKGQMISEIESAAFNLKEGEYSSVIEANNGFYIFLVKTRYPQEEVSLEKAKNTIYGIIAQEKFQKQLRAWLDELRKKAYIEIKD